MEFIQMYLPLLALYTVVLFFLRMYKRYYPIVIFTLWSLYSFILRFFDGMIFQIDAETYLITMLVGLALFAPACALGSLLLAIFLPKKEYFKAKMANAVFLLVYGSILWIAWQLMSNASF